MTDPAHSSIAPVRVLIAGGGVAALEAALALRASGRDRVRVEVLAPGDFVHRPWSVRTPFTGVPVSRLSLDRLTQVGVHVHEGALSAVDVSEHRVLTTGGARLDYDRLIVATGARSAEAIPGATTFRGPVSAGVVEAALRRARRDPHGRLLFVVPDATGWTLPLYELALLAAHEGGESPELVIVSPETRPLELFGRTASDAVARLLDRAGVGFDAATSAESAFDGALLLRDGRLLSSTEVIALPRLRPTRIEGLPTDRDGFIPIDEHARVLGTDHVFAAGDVTATAVKQGGLAAQQADAAAELIAADAGAGVLPRPYRPVLRGILLTGEEPLYLRTDLATGASVVRRLPPAAARTSGPGWWPPDKIAGRFLGGFLARTIEPNTVSLLADSEATAT